MSFISATEHAAMRLPAKGYHVAAAAGGGVGAGDNTPRLGNFPRG